MAKPQTITQEITEREEVELHFDSMDSMIRFATEITKRGKDGWVVRSAVVTFERKRYTGGVARIVSGPPPRRRR